MNKYMQKAISNANKTTAGGHGHCQTPVGKVLVRFVHGNLSTYKPRKIWDLNGKPISASKLEEKLKGLEDA